MKLPNSITYFCIASVLLFFTHCTTGDKQYTCDTSDECPPNQLCITLQASQVGSFRTPAGSKLCLQRCQTSNDCKQAQCVTMAFGKSGRVCIPCSQTEDTCDGTDNDCDGQIDNVQGSLTPINCPNGATCKQGKCETTSTNKCKNGETRPCYTGATNTRDKGACKSGKQTCKEETWQSQCVGEVLPTTEVCNGIDDNCDGQTDEGCSCKPGDTQTCGSSDKGECKKGTQTCNDKGKWDACSGELKPSTEVCDGKDNDCNGKIDDIQELGKPCTDPSRKGLCHPGTWTCDSNNKVCKPTTQPTKEICGDGKDNDCNGQIDEKSAGCNCKPGDKQPCGASDVGECKKGTQTCTDQSSWGPCSGEVTSTSEVCDGKDNDCNGKVDESLPDCTQKCTSSSECPATAPNCQGGACVRFCLKDTECDDTYRCLQKFCQPCPSKTKRSDTELCDNSDNNCNGQVDENLERSCYGSKSGCIGTPGSYKCTGLCKAGKQTCNQGKWGTCTNAIEPAKEICDEKDNDCDGQIDNTSNCVTSYAGTGVKGYKDGPKDKAQFDFPRKLAVDSKGNVYVLEQGKPGWIRKIDTLGNVSVFAGAFQQGLKDAKGTSARFRALTDIAIGPNDMVYVADAGNRRIRKIDNAGNVSTFAQVESVSQLVVDKNGDLFVSTNSTQNPLLKIDRNGIVQNIKVSYERPSARAIAIDPIGNLVVNFRSIRTSGSVYKNAIYTPKGKELSWSSSFENGSQWESAAFDKSGMLYIVRWPGNAGYRIYQRDWQDKRTTIAGVNTRCLNGQNCYKNGNGLSAQFSRIYGIAIDQNGHIFVADVENHRIRKITRKDEPCLQEGTTQTCYSGDPTTSGKSPCKSGTQTCRNGFWTPCQGEVLPIQESCDLKDTDCDGSIDNGIFSPYCQLQQGVCDNSRQACLNGKWVACTTASYTSHSSNYSATETCDTLDNDCDGKVDEGVINCVTTIAGTKKGHQDGLALQAQFENLKDIVRDSAGNLYIAELYRIRKLDTKGIVTTIAGTGANGFKDGPALQAQFSSIMGITLDGQGNMYIGDHLRLRKLSLTTMQVSTLAGDGTSSYKDGPGLQAKFAGIKDIALDSSSNTIYILDQSNHRIRKYDIKALSVSTFSGSGTRGSKDGSKNSAQFFDLSSITLDSSGALLVADSSVGIRKVDASGNVTTLITDALEIQSVVADSFGNLYTTRLSGRNESTITQYTAAGKLVRDIVKSDTRTKSFADGPLGQMVMNRPGRLLLDSKDNILFLDGGNSLIRLITLR